MPSQNDNNPRHQVVLMRESGLPASEVGKAAGLSTPTVLSLHEAYKAGSWAAVDGRTRGRPRVPQTQTAPTGLVAQFVADNTKLWTTDLLARWLSQAESKVINARAAQRRMSQWGWLPNVKPRKGALIAGTHITPNKGLYLLWACLPRVASSCGSTFPHHPPTKTIAHSPRTSWPNTTKAFHSIFCSRARNTLRCSHSGCKHSRRSNYLLLRHLPHQHQRLKS